MSGFLGDVAAAFGAILGPVYPVGSLGRSGWSDDSNGSVSRKPTQTPISVQTDRLTYAMTTADGFTASDVRLIILSVRPDNGEPVPTPQDDDTVTVDGKTYRLDLVAGDAAGSHWEARGHPVRGA